NPVDTPSQTTTYICEVNDGNTTATEEKTVTVYDPIIVDAGPDMGLELGQSTQFDGSYSGGSGNITILWEGVGNSIPIADPSILNPIVGPFTDIDVYYFTLTVIDNITGCENVDELFVDVILRIGEVDALKVKVYPNPTSGELFISTHEKPEMVSVINMTGNEVFYSEDCQEIFLTGRQVTQIDLSRLPSGMYFVRITMNGITYVKKVDKQ
ncbi:MAG: T9SS type A sorting domain-containing protein, partial [Bacteroidales bacterium]|nr:T9SS type A sorting domain-containing protein [Bacteroidales bacterium]